MTEPDMVKLIEQHEAVIHNAAISACCDVILKQLRKPGRREVKAALDVLYDNLKALKR